MQARADELAGQLEALHRAQERALQEAQQDAARRQSELVSAPPSSLASHTPSQPLAALCRPAAPLPPS